MEKGKYVVVEIGCGLEGIDYIVGVFNDYKEAKEVQIEKTDNNPNHTYIILTNKDFKLLEKIFKS